MKPYRWILTPCFLLALAAVAAADDDKGAADALKDRIQGTWQGVKGDFAAQDKLTFRKYEAFKPGTAGDYTFAETRGDLTGPDGKKLPPTDVTVGAGSYSLDGTKLKLHPGALPGPIGRDDVVWEVTKVTDDALVLTTDKGKTEEFKKVR